MPHIFVYLPHDCEAPADLAAELATAARAIDGSAATTLVSGYGERLDAACNAAMAYFPEVWKLSHPQLAHSNSELIRPALAALLPPKSILLLIHNYLGIDLAPGLAIKMNANAAYLPDVLEFSSVSAEKLEAVRQEFGGQVSTHVQCDLTSGAVITLRPGVFTPAAASTTPGSVLDKSSSIASLKARRRHIQTIPGERGAVDITRHDILVAIGRGIQAPENIAMAEEVAASIGAAVCCSRPVVDARWMEKSRQVGSSGKTVRPKVYLACGISGSFQHLTGIKGKPLLIAVNKNPKAPIFQVADVGVVDDVLEFLPALAARLGATAK